MALVPVVRRLIVACTDCFEILQKGVVGPSV
jgi:hypothetical protein